MGIGSLQTNWLSRERLPMAALTCVILAAACGTAIGYWPGLMTWDAVRQYGQAIDGDFDDWHPPAMEWLWRQLIPIHRGPAPMLVLQLGLYWSGFALIGAWALAAGRRRIAVALVACGLLPLAMALMGAVLKDCLMAGALVAATGLLLWTDRRRTVVVPIVGIVLLLLAATLRFNAFLACLPLMVALLPGAFRSSLPRFATTTLVAAIMLVLAMPVANRLIGAEPSGVELSLVIFDLGGITEHAGVNVFPSPPAGADAVAINHRCYSPVKWDPYSNWVDPVCPIGFQPFRDAIAASGQSPYGLLVRAVLAHPIAYAEHRLRHFNINTRFLVHDEIERPVQAVSAPNIWSYRTHPNPALIAIDRVTLASARTPLGWPIVYIALALGMLIACPGLASQRLIVPIALSAFLYGMGYGVFSVAAELRYHLWTMIAALIATVLTMGDIATMPGARMPRLARAFAPAIVVAILAGAWRLTA